MSLNTSNLGPVSNPDNLSAAELSALIDHTLLKSEATSEDVAKTCSEAREYGFKSVCVHGAWMPEGMIREAGCEPASLEQLLSESQPVFVTASVTTENKGFHGKRHFDLMADGAIFVLLSRAGVVDFDAFTKEALVGRIRVATDVFPKEPLSKDYPIRKAENAVLSAHRAGGLAQAFYMMGELVLDDLKLMMKRLPPRRCKRAERETGGRLRSKPVGKS